MTAAEARDLIAVTPTDERGLLLSGYSAEQVSYVIRYRAQVLSAFEGFLREPPAVRRRKKVKLKRHKPHSEVEHSTYDRRFKLTAEMRESIVEMLKAGDSARMLAARFGVSSKCIREMRVRAGLPRRIAVKYGPGVFCPMDL